MIIEIKKEENKLRVYIGLGDLSDNTITHVYKDPRLYDEVAINNCRNTIPELENENDELSIFCKFDGDEHAFQMYCADYVVIGEECSGKIGFYDGSKFECASVTDRIVIYNKKTLRKFPILKRILNMSDDPKKKKKKKEAEE